MPALKIACVGSAPSSVRLAPFNDPTWKIFGCSPGVMQYARRVHAWLEVHRPEFGVVGQPETQKQWFSPEYVAWMATLPCVFMAHPMPQIPNSVALPVETLVNKYGNIWFTSSLAWMMALSIEDILERRKLRGTDDGNPELAPLVEGEIDTIGLYGVDMAATEEYGYQRAGCQRFIELCTILGIHVAVPPESDLLRTMPLYGIMESSPWHIKGLARQRELEARLAGVRNNLQMLQQEEAFVRGALDDHKYHMDTWGESRPFLMMGPELLAESPMLQKEMMKGKQGEIDAAIGRAMAKGALDTIDKMQMEESALDKSKRTKKPVLAAHITRGKPAKIRA